MNSNVKQKLLITGGAGFIGSNFVKMALTKGYFVAVLDSFTYAGHRENLKDYEKLEHFKLIEGSICDPQLIPKLLKEYGFNAILNFAAESHVDRSIHGPALFLETNILGTFNLLSAALSYWKSHSEHDQFKREFRFLQVSTDEVYGSLGPTGFFNEATPYAPNSPYSASKASGDHLVRAWHHTYGLPTLTTNCSNNYGPYQFPEKLIPTIITRALTNQFLPVYGDGQNIRDWIHVEDHCRGIFLALEKGTPGATYCFGGNSEKNNLEVVHAICKHLDQFQPRSDGRLHSAGIQFVTDRLGHDRRYAIDDRLAQNDLGFKRHFTFDEGLAQTVQWYLENSKWSESVLRKSK